MAKKRRGLWLLDPDEIYVPEIQLATPEPQSREHKKSFTGCELCGNRIRKKAVSKHHYWWEKKSFEKLSENFKLIKYKLCLDCHAGYHIYFLRNCRNRTECFVKCPYQQICCYREINQVMLNHGITVPLSTRLITVPVFAEYAPQVVDLSVRKFIIFGQAEKIPSSFKREWEAKLHSA